MPPPPKTIKLLCDTASGLVGKWLVPIGCPPPQDGRLDPPLMAVLKKTKLLSCSCQVHAECDFLLVRADPRPSRARVPGSHCEVPGQTAHDTNLCDSHSSPERNPSRKHRRNVRTQVSKAAHRHLSPIVTQVWRACGAGTSGPICLGVAARHRRRRLAGKMVSSTAFVCVVMETQRGVVPGAGLYRSRHNGQGVVD